MKTIAHISDLHFGTEEPLVTESLREDLQAIAPALVVVSGDLTQRARRHQFEAARDYLQRLPSPQLIVPGNHDVPLYDVFRRFIFPLSRYHRHISPDANPCYRDREMMVVGLNTARSLTWQNGRISFDQIKLAQALFNNVSEPLFKILVTHHPFIPPPGKSPGAVKLVGRAQAALKVLDLCGVDLLLAGHLHHGYTGDVRTFYPATKRSIIVAQAGTAISRRVRNEPNAYNVIAFNHDTISIAVRIFRDRRFEESAMVRYRLKQQEWHVEERSLRS